MLQERKRLHRESLERKLEEEMSSLGENEREGRKPAERRK